MRASGGCRPPEDADALIDLGCDLADAGRQTDAEWCFRRASDLGDTVASFNLGNALAAQQRWEEAVAAYELALAGGEPDAWRNLGKVLEDLGDLAGAMRAYRGAADAGDLEGGLQLAFLLREQGERRRRPWTSPMEIAAMGDQEAAAVVACWRWCATLDPALEPDLRAGAELLPRRAGRPRPPAAGDRPRRRGPRSCSSAAPSCGEAVAWLPLGNFYADEMEDDEAAEEAYRGGIAAGERLLPPQPRRPAGRARRLRRRRRAVPPRRGRR